MLDKSQEKQNMKNCKQTQTTNIQETNNQTKSRKKHAKYNINIK